MDILMIPGQKTEQAAWPEIANEIDEALRTCSIPQRRAWEFNSSLDPGATHEEARTIGDECWKPPLLGTRWRLKKEMLVECGCEHGSC